ncbi:MAG TPA: substrate-binding domain-containing protein [Solirubrobacteraceae bacterium]|nr:substrate-binding domain-containing protein [Solirubrobacteraceae bacterium]
MRSLSARRMVACIASVAAVAAVVPASASAAAPKTDRGEQCSGDNIVGRGSTFQNPAQLIWQPGFNTNTSTIACDGTYGSKGTPKAEYRNTKSEDRGSGSCLKVFGAEKETPNREYSFCGTDEAPNETQKSEIESHKTGGGENSLLTIPVVQGSVAVIVHLPEGCKASGELVEKGKTYKLGRLVLDDKTIEGIYAGTINNWKEAIAAQGGSGNDSLSCTGGTAEEETPITRVVRTDHSGTTHIFKAFLEQVETKKLKMEAYEESYDGSSTGCHAKYPAEEKTWAEVSEACQNQRWPEAAHVVRNTETGNPGVVKLVNSTASSIGYADLAVAREYAFFSAKAGTNKYGETHPAGGENKKGSATKVGEQNTRFWAPIQNNLPSETPTYADPASKWDTEAVASSNCKNTKYIENEEKEFPPASVRDLWNEAKAALKEEHYAICGLTFDLAFREYFPYLSGTPFEATGKETATTVENYLEYEVSSKGGGKEIKDHDYEALPSAVIKEAEAGIKEIGYKVA